MAAQESPRKVPHEQGFDPGFLLPKSYPLGSKLPSFGNLKHIRRSLPPLLQNIHSFNQMIHMDLSERLTLLVSKQEVSFCYQLKRKPCWSAEWIAIRKGLQLNPHQYCALDGR